MTIEETKAWLRSYRLIVKESERTEEELLYWRSRAEKMTREMSSQPSGSGGGKSMETAIEKIMELEEKLGATHNDLLERKAAIETAIDSLSNETYRLLLRLKYINGNKWETIAVKMNYNYRWILYLHGRALQAIATQHSNAH